MSGCLFPAIKPVLMVLGSPCWAYQECKHAHSARKAGARHKQGQRRAEQQMQTSDAAARAEQAADHAAEVLAFESRNPLVATSLDGGVHTVKHGWVGQDLRAALSKHNPTLGHPSTFMLMGKDGTAVRDTIDPREAKSMQNPGTFTLMFRSLVSQSAV